MGMRGHGINGVGTVADNAALDMGTESFSIEALIDTDRLLTDQLGDIVTKFNQATRLGYLLSLTRQGGCDQSNYGYIQFGMDNAQAAAGFTQVAAQLNAQTYICSLAVWNGALYGGTNPNGLLFTWKTGVAATWQMEPGIAHIVGVKDNATLTMRLYLNGILVNTSAAFIQANYNLDNANTLLLGFGFQDYFNYVMHTVKVYKGRVLTDQEIKNKYAALRTAAWKTHYEDISVDPVALGGVVGQYL
jgi:hypothetical protein